ncbi:hypothetical protein AAII07_48435, partial [Microvirga sp. 0TCS3.31]
GGPTARSKPSCRGTIAPERHQLPAYVPPDGIVREQASKQSYLDILHRLAEAAMPETVENLILGGGEPGKYIAWELAGQGRRTVVVERALIGGSCPNIACLPSKNVIHSAKVADLLHHASACGLRTGPAATDMKDVRERKRAMVDGLINRGEVYSPSIGPKLTARGE